MAGLASEVSNSQSTELLNRFGRAGWTMEDVRRLLGDDEYLEQIVSASRCVPDSLSVVKDRWTSVEEQFELIAQGSERFGWGFTPTDYTRAGCVIPECPDDPLTALVLVPYLETPQKTFAHLWELGLDRYEDSYHWDGYKKVLTDNVIRLLPGIEHPGKCLRWEVIDFGSHRGKAPRDVRDPKISPHAGVLASVWLHPNWVKSMDGDKVPYVWASGYQVNVPGRAPWQSVPYVSFNRHRREVELHCCWDGHRHSDWSVPSFGM